MTWLTAKIGGWLAAAGALILLVFGAWQKGRREGKDIMQAEQERHRREMREIKRKSDDEVDGLGHADVDQRFDRWVRGSEQR